MAPPPQQPTLGPYVLVDRIAAGGMAEVFRARIDRRAGEPRTVVVKRMLPHVAAAAETREMFAEEARLGALVHHPRVVQVLDSGQAQGQPYLVLEYVPGVDLWRLGRWLQRQGRTLGVPLSLFVVCQLLEGLQAVHEATDAEGDPLEIVHRDVSPSNVLLSAHGEVKLGDFGIARQLEHSYHHGLGGRKGKLGYLAPEQVAGDALTRAADVFAAGVITAELLMGAPLFTGGSELAILLAIRDAHIQPFLERAGSLPEGLTDAVAEALTRDARDRIPSADALRARLAAFQTEAEPALRRELGELVAQAMGERERNLEPTPLESRDVFDAETPLGPDADADEQRDAATADVPDLEYRVATTDGRRHGPWTFAKLVEAIATGDVGPDDRVTHEDELRPVRKVPELRRHLPSASTTPVTRDADTPAVPDREVTIRGDALVRALCRTTLARETGLWLCEQGGVRKEVYVSQGVPEFVSSNVAGELLGEHLVAHGVISRGELDMALAVMPRFEGRLGDTLVALDLIAPVELFRQIAGQVREKLLDLFLWTSGAATFYADVPPPPSGFPLGLEPWSIVDEGLGRRLAQGLEEERFRTRMTTPLRRVPKLPAGLERAALPLHARRLLNTLEQPRIVIEVVDELATPEDPNRGYRTVLLLLLLGALQWVEEG